MAVEYIHTFDNAERCNSYEQSQDYTTPYVSLVESTEDVRYESDVVRLANDIF